jgi:hypothetical protein
MGAQDLGVPAARAGFCFAFCANGLMGRKPEPGLFYELLVPFVDADRFVTARPVISDGPMGEITNSKYSICRSFVALMNYT